MSESSPKPPKVPSPKLPLNRAPLSMQTVYMTPFESSEVRRVSPHRVNTVVAGPNSNSNTSNIKTSESKSPRSPSPAAEKRSFGDSDIKGLLKVASLTRIHADKSGGNPKDLIVKDSGSASPSSSSLMRKKVSPNGRPRGGSPPPKQKKEFPNIEKMLRLDLAKEGGGTSPTGKSGKVLLNS